MPETRISPASDSPRRLRTLEIGAIVMHLFVSLGALIGGGLLILSPDGSALGLSLELLRHTPFGDYRIPGVMLFGLNGIGHLAAGLALARHHTWAWGLSAAMGLTLMGWIGVQVLMIRAVMGIHVLYVGLGLALCLAGIRLKPPS